MGLFDQKEKQRVILFRENRQIKRPAFVVLGNRVSDSKTLNEWFRFREYLQREKTYGKGKNNVLPVDERSAIPISPYHYHTDEQLMKLVDADSVADQAEDLMSTQVEANKNKSRFQDMLGISIMGMVFFLMIVVILFLTGRLKIGS